MQLPPINKDADNHLLDKPHVFLDEIMRQAQESEIIRVSMDIRAGRPLKPMRGKDVIIAHKKDLNTGMLAWADQVLCATNKTRQELNLLMRRMNGIESDLPVDGDKMICLRNYWEEDFDCEDPLINGTIGILKNSYTTNFRLPLRYGGFSFPVIMGELHCEEGSIFKNFQMDCKLITTGEKTIDDKLAYRVKKSKYSGLIPHEFAYGQVITCWKAQGSQWSKVLTLEENHPFGREEHQRYLYTAITRAEEKAVIILKN